MKLIAIAVVIMMCGCRAPVPMYNAHVTSRTEYVVDSYMGEKNCGAVIDKQFSSEAIKYARDFDKYAAKEFRTHNEAVGWLTENWCMPSPTPAAQERKP